MSKPWHPRGLMNPRKEGGGMPGTMNFQVSTTYAATIYPGDLLKMLATGFVAHKEAFTNTTTVLQSFLGVADGFLPKVSSDAKTRGIDVITDVEGCTWEGFVSGSITQANVGDTALMKSHGGVGRPATYQSTAYISVLAGQMWEVVSLGRDPKDEAESGGVVVVRLSRAIAT